METTMGTVVVMMVAKGMAVAKGVGAHAFRPATILMLREAIKTKSPRISPQARWT